MKMHDALGDSMGPVNDIFDINTHLISKPAKQKKASYNKSNSANQSNTSVLSQHNISSSCSHDLSSSTPSSSPPPPLIQTLPSASVSSIHSGSSSLPSQNQGFLSTNNYRNFNQTSPNNFNNANNGEESSFYHNQGQNHHTHQIKSDNNKNSTPSYNHLLFYPYNHQNSLNHNHHHHHHHNQQQLQTHSHHQESNHFQHNPHYQFYETDTSNVNYENGHYMNATPCSGSHLTGIASFSGTTGAANENHATNPYEWYNNQYQNSSTNNNSGSSNNNNIVTSSATNNNLLASFYTAHSRPIMNYT